MWTVDWEIVELEFRKISKETDEEVIKAFNKNVRNSWSWYAKMLFLSILREEFIKRNFDYSIISDSENSISYARKIILKDKKIYIDENDII